MKKFGLIVADPPWSFNDKLVYDNKIKRGAASIYPVLDAYAIARLPVEELAEDNCLLALWVPSSLIKTGMDVMEAWGFDYRQLWIWAKTQKNNPTGLAFGMGRLARNCHEPCLIGIRGKYAKELADKSQRNVIMHPALPHSKKPEDLQNRLEKMFPSREGLELFARRKRHGWTCLGNQAPDTLGEDIRDSITNLLK